MDKNERTKLERQIALNEEKQSQYIMRASKTIISILHRGFDKIKQDGRVMVLDELSAEKLYDRLYLVKSKGTYKVAFENDSKTYKDMLSPTNRWLFPNAYLRIFGKKFMKDIGFDADKPKSSTKSKIPKKRMEQIEQHIDEIDDNTKQFASVLNELPTSEDNQDNIMLQDIITKNEIATDNSVKLIETSLTEIGEDASTQTGRYPNQIYQIRESIMKFLDTEMGTLGERIRTLSKEQGITIISILTALGMTLRVLIEALLGGPSTTSTPTSQSTTTSDKKGGDREWIKNKLKALSQLLSKLADKVLASLPGIIGSIISWILNRAKEVVGWLSQNLWALITGVGVLIYTYFMTKTNRK